MYIDQNKHDLASTRGRLGGVWEKISGKDPEIPSDKDAARHQFYLVFDLGEVV